MAIPQEILDWMTKMARVWPTLGDVEGLKSHCDQYLSRGWSDLRQMYAEDVGVARIMMKVALEKATNMYERIMEYRYVEAVEYDQIQAIIKSVQN